MIAFVGICCSIVGTVLGAMKASGREHLTVSLLMIGKSKIFNIHAHLTFSKRQYSKINSWALNKQSTVFDAKLRQMSISLSLNVMQQPFQCRYIAINYRKSQAIIGFCTRGKPFLTMRPIGNAIGHRQYLQQKKTSLENALTYTLSLQALPFHQLQSFLWDKMCHLNFSAQNDKS